MKIPFPHELEWSSSKIAYFWDWRSKNVDFPESYFSKIFGDGLIKHIIKSKIVITTPAVDLGCGTGALLGKLISNNIKSYGIDISKEAINIVINKFRNNPHFLGARVGDLDNIPLDNREVGTIFLIETLEHLLPGKIKGVFTDLRRILKPDGRLILTVPYNENLEHEKVCCPECGCIFHRKQHIHSFNKESIKGLMLDNGFNPIKISATNLRNYQGNDSIEKIMAIIRRSTSRIRKYGTPHLICIAAKK